MPDKKVQKNENSNISENTRWDIPIVDPNAGSTIPKPPTNLNPDKNQK